MRNIKNPTYNNIMVVANRIEKEKGYDIYESARLAKNIVQEFCNHPKGLSINARINQILTKAEWEKEYAE